MLEFKNNVRLVQSVGELPLHFVGAKDLFIDLETTSGDRMKDSLNPWFNCSIAGIGITVDKESWAYYIPINHSDKRWNLDPKPVTRWLKDVLAGGSRWINQNIKYDMHVLENEYGLAFSGKIIDTLTLAKTFESDRLSYALEDLASHFLGHDILHLKQALEPWLKRDGKTFNKDYGLIPADVMAAYGGEDVLTVRRLFNFFTQTIYETRAADIEEKVTPILYRMENTGMRTKPNLLDAMNVFHLQRLIEIEQELFKTTGTHIRPHVGDDCHELLCHQYGLPVLALTNQDDDEKESNPSFTKDALQQYLVYPGAPVELVKLLMEYRQKNTFRTYFLEPYTNLHIDGVMHPSYTQAVRTGRMACRSPNAQQLNAQAKRLIVPPDGCSFLSIDYSQIEFRLIAHYIRDRKTIEAYNQNPDTDFHQWVADLCGILRKPAKTVNFCMGYGGGKKRLVQTLSKDVLLVMSIKKEIDGMGLKPDEAVALFERRAAARAEEVYWGYHNALPSLRSTSKEAEARARRRGYVYNLIGRRRYLSDSRAHIAFNALNQSSAADILKERLPFIEAAADSLGLEIVAIVHDEVLFQGSTEIIEQRGTVRLLLSVMETPDIPISVPIRCSYGWSSESWAHCKQEAVWPLKDSTWLRRKALN